MLMLTLVYSFSMGTGILSILIYNLPYQFKGVDVIAGVFFGINIIIFVALLLMSISRYLIYPGLFKLLLIHPMNLYISTFVMGFHTIITMIVNSLAPKYGYTFTSLAYVFWWISVVLSILSCVGIPFIQMTRQNIDHQQILATFLLPVVTCIVCSSTGGAVAAFLPVDQSQICITVSYILLGFGLPLSIIVLSSYYNRLLVYKIPTSAAIMTTFLPIGPFGQGAYSIIKLSNDLNDIALNEGIIPFFGNFDPQLAPISSRALQVFSIPVALIIWGKFYLILIKIHTYCLYPLYRIRCFMVSFCVYFIN